MPSRRVSRRRPWKGRLILERVLMNLPAYWARNVEKVTAGTGEALPGPAALRVAVGASCPITGLKSGRGTGAGRESEAAVVPIEPSGQQNRR